VGGAGGHTAPGAQDVKPGEPSHTGGALYGHGVSSFGKTRLDPHTMMICDQCQREFHAGCVDKDMKQLPKGDWFCGKECKDLSDKVASLCRTGQTRVMRATTSLGGEEHLTMFLDNREDRKVKRTTEEMELKRKLLRRCANVISECFLPMKDARTQKNLLPLIVRGKSCGLHDFSGFVCFALVSSEAEVLCVATVRILGSRFCEMPFIAVPFAHRGKGYSTRTMRELESHLRELGVSHLVLPALGEIKEFWQHKGYQPLEAEEPKDLLKYKILRFPGCQLLRKALASSDQPQEKGPVAVVAEEKQERRAAEPLKTTQEERKKMAESDQDQKKMRMMQEIQQSNQELKELTSQLEMFHSLPAPPTPKAAPEFEITENYNAITTILEEISVAIKSNNIKF